MPACVVTTKMRRNRNVCRFSVSIAVSVSSRRMIAGWLEETFEASDSRSFGDAVNEGLSRVTSARVGELERTTAAHANAPPIRINITQNLAEIAVIAAIVKWW